MAPRETLPENKAPEKGRGLHPLWHLVIALVALALVQAFVVKVYAIPSPSMEPTLMSGDRILVDRITYSLGSPSAGDVIVFNADPSWGPSPSEGDSTIEKAIKVVSGVFGIGPGLNHAVTKRVLAIEGQTIECCDLNGNILIDGVPAPAHAGTDFEFSTGVIDCNTSPPSQRCFSPVTVPEGSVVVVGDNALNSRDSLTMCRGNSPLSDCLLTVQVEDVVGRVILRIAPLERFGLVA